MHELKKFVDDGFEELPVGSEKAWVLADDVHDVGGYDGLVVLSSLLLAQTQQILRHKHKVFQKSDTKPGDWLTYRIRNKIIHIYQK